MSSEYTNTIEHHDKHTVKAQRVAFFVVLIGIMISYCRSLGHGEEHLSYAVNESFLVECCHLHEPQNVFSCVLHG